MVMYSKVRPIAPQRQVPQPPVPLASLERMTAVLVAEPSVEPILETLGSAAAEALRVDRTLLFRVDLEQRRLEVLGEWLNPDVLPKSLRGPYPLAPFAGADATMRETRSIVESHADRPHPALVREGSVAVHHGDTNAKSLLWAPFHFTDSGYYFLCVHHLTRRTWKGEELGFLRAATQFAQVSLEQRAFEAASAGAENAAHDEVLRLIASAIAHQVTGLLVTTQRAIARAQVGLGVSHPLTRALGNASEAASEAEKLAKQLLSYADDDAAVAQEVNLSALVSEMLGLMGAVASPIPVHAALGTHVLVRGRASELRQLVVNLVANARDAMKDRKGTIVVSVKGRPARHGERSSAVLTVQDAGTGMPMEIQMQLAQEVFRAPGQRRTSGLAIVHRIVRAHDGAILVDSELHQGTSFSVILPALEATPRSC
jgi:signal transduction histidine kinase